MAALLPVSDTLEEFLTNAGVKKSAEIAEKLTEEEIESIQDLLDIEESILLETLTKTCGIKAGSATKIYAYCQKVKGGGVAASAASGGGGGGAAAANNVGDGSSKMSSNNSKLGGEATDMQGVLDGISELEELIERADDKADIAGYAITCAKGLLKLVAAVPGVGSIAEPLVDALGYVSCSVIVSLERQLLFRPCPLCFSVFCFCGIEQSNGSLSLPPVSLSLCHTHIHLIGNNKTTKTPPTNAK